ncbi:MAG TPA: hypothetical protein VK308_10650 [Pyrinomonadaceae bacterium]|nr:hypothetical protein [Pyrinomonadaceae bacterium]
MNKAKLIRSCGIFCIVAVLTGIVWTVINFVYPNSTGSTATNDFVVLHPLLHRFEHAVCALLLFPGLFAALLGYYFSGAIGNGWFGKILLALAATGALMATAGSLIEAIVLQWETADAIRGFGFSVILLLLCPLLFGTAALIYRKIVLWKRILPLLLPVLFFSSFWVIFAVFNMN